MMFQKFYSDTLGSRFIKSLLGQTPIPMFDSVTDGDYLVSGCYYIYKHYIIYCSSSGVLALDKEEYLYPSDNVYPSEHLFPRVGNVAAKFYVKTLLNSEDIKTHNVYRSTTNYYDSDTHYRLGRYLRYLKTTSDLNLMPFYNCYNSTYFSDIELTTSGTTVGVKRVSKQSHKVVAIPIMFNKTYTIAIDSSTKVAMRAVVHDNSGYVEETSLPEELQNNLKTSGVVYPNLQFNQHKTFKINCSNYESIMLQHNLYLVIQLPIDNDSSIVVLEDYIDNSGIQCDNNYVRKVLPSNISLLNMNTRESYAFSFRLLEYLLGNVIHKGDVIHQNISKVQTALSKQFVNYYDAFLHDKYRKGTWDKDLSRHVLRLLDNNRSDIMLYDQDGNINVDVEKILYGKGGSY